MVVEVGCMRWSSELAVNCVMVGGWLMAIVGVYQSWPIAISRSNDWSMSMTITIGSGQWGSCKSGGRRLVCGCHVKVVVGVGQQQSPKWSEDVAGVC